MQEIAKNSREVPDKDIWAMYLDLRTEIDTALGAGRVPDNQPVRIPNPIGLSRYERRTVIRSISAFVEAITFCLKRFSLSLASSHKLTPAELSLADEKGYDLDEHGEAQVRVAKLRTLANMRFAFRLLAKCCNGNFKLEVSGQGWSNLRTTIAVRDRLMHPKLLSDLIISDREITQAVAAYVWFDWQVVLVLSNAIRVCVSELEKIAAGHVQHEH